MLASYMLIGEVLKPQGVRGEAKLKVYCTNPEDFLKWKTVFRQVGSQYVPMSAACSRVSDGFAYVTLEGCHTPEDVGKLRGAQIFIDREHAAALEDNKIYIADLIGCEGIDEQGRSIGKLVDVTQYGMVDTWIFEDHGKELLAPALESVFTEVDPVAGVIRVNRAALDEVAVRED